MLLFIQSNTPRSGSMRKGLIITTLALLATTACTKISQTPSPTLSYRDKWVVFPLTNNTETPMAGRRAQAIAQGLLNARGIGHASAFEPARGKGSMLGINTARYSDSDILRYGRRMKAHYVLAGAVNEWRYKVGVDGEPAVGLTLKIWDVKTRRLVWSAVGSKVGSSQQSVSYIAQSIIQQSLGQLRLG
jgi:hypothetical protein